MVGYNTCLAAAIARYLVIQDEPGSANLAALAKGSRRGYPPCASCTPRATRTAVPNPKRPESAFPYRLVAADIENPTTRYAQTEVRDPLGVLAPSSDRTAQAPRTGMYTILSQQCCDDLLSLARQIVQKGPEKALANIPLGRFGKLLTVDRSEIESYRTDRGPGAGVHPARKKRINRSPSPSLAPPGPGNPLASRKSPTPSATASKRSPSTCRR